MKLEEKATLGGVELTIGDVYQVGIDVRTLEDEEPVLDYTSGKLTGFDSRKIILDCSTQFNSIIKTYLFSDLASFERVGE